VPLEDSSTAAAGEADIADQDLHFHDLRGTAATKFYIAGLSIRVIAAILAWREDQVDRVYGEFVITLPLASGTVRGNGPAKRSDQELHG